MRQFFLALTLLSLFFGAKGSAINVYTANRLTGNVTVIDSDTNLIIATITASPSNTNIVVSPDDTFTYTPNDSGGGVTLSIIENSSLKVVATITTGGRSQGINISADGLILYNSLTSANQVQVYNALSRTLIATLTVGTQPRKVTPTADGSLLYVSCQNGINAVIVLDGLALVPVATITVNSGLQQPLTGALRPPNEDFFYSVNNRANGGNTISVIDTSNFLVIATITVLNACSGIDFLSDGMRAYVPGQGTGVNVIDTISLKVISTITAPGASSLVVTPDDQFIYVSGRNQDVVYLIETSTLNLIATITFPPVRPQQIALAKGGTPSPPPPPPPSPPPSSTGIVLTGETISNSFLTQEDLINVISWFVTGLPNAHQFLLYRDEDWTDLVAIIPVTSPMEFKDHNRIPKTTYTYFVVAEDAYGTPLIYSSLIITTP